MAPIQIKVKNGKLKAFYNQEEAVTYVVSVFKDSDKENLKNINNKTKKMKFTKYKSAEEFFKIAGI